MPYQHHILSVYDKTVLPKSFKGDLVLWKVTEDTNAYSKGSFEKNWKRPYCVDKLVGFGAYKLLYMDGMILKHMWSATMLRKYY